MADSPLRIMVVTPERSALDEHADSITLPMFDGERGVFASHAAFVGQLGPGELRIRTGTETKRYFIDGGFVQVARNVVNVLTPRAVPAADVTAAKAEQARTEAEALPSTNNAERETRSRAIARAQGMARVASRTLYS